MRNFEIICRSPSCYSPVQGWSEWSLLATPVDGEAGKGGGLGGSWSGEEGRSKVWFWFLRFRTKYLYWQTNLWYVGLRDSWRCGWVDHQLQGVLVILVTSDLLCEHGQERENEGEKAFKTILITDQPNSPIFLTRNSSYESFPSLSLSAKSNISSISSSSTGTGKFFMICLKSCWKIFIKLPNIRITNYYLTERMLVKLVFPGLIVCWVGLCTTHYLSKHNIR